MKKIILSIFTVLSIFFSTTAVCAGTMGDVNNDNDVDLADSIMALQVQVGVSTSQPVSLQADVNSDGKIGFEEAIYALQVTTGLKPSIGFTAEMLDAGPTYYSTKTGDPEGTTNQGTTQATYVISGTGPYIITVTEEYFDASNVSQGTNTTGVDIVLNANGTLTATVSGDPNTTTITLTSQTATFLDVHGDVGDGTTWDESWLFAEPAGWLTSG